MRETAELPQMRKLWRVMKLCNLPINDPRVTSMTEEQVDLMLWSSLLDNPEALKNLNQQFYDPEFEDYDREEESTEIYNKNFNNSGGDSSFKGTTYHSNSMENNQNYDGNNNTDDSSLKDFDDDWEEVL